MVGQNAVVEQVIVALVASGHALIEGVPGLGKTLLVRALSQALSLNHARVQFTPDMMPSDITGHAVLDPSTRELRVVRGPVFTHVLLADEINRAPAKTQSALLEVMQEYQVTLEGQTLPLPQPSSSSRRRIRSRPKAPIRCQKRSSIAFCSKSRSAIRRCGGSRGRRAHDGESDRPATSACDVKPCSTSVRADAAAIAARQRVDENVIDYAVRIVRASREWPGFAFGAGSRGAIALVRGASRRTDRRAGLRDAR